MTEAERQAILSSAKTFFRTRIAENHKANTEKLTSLSKFNINPFTHKYLAQFAFGDSSPESMARSYNTFVMKSYRHTLLPLLALILNSLMLLMAVASIAK